MAADETRRVLEHYTRAWVDGDAETLLGAYADHVVFHYFGTSDLAGDHVGKEAAVTAMLTASTRAARTLVEVVDVTAGDSLGSIVVRERLERDGRSAELQRVLLYRVEAEQIAECWLYDPDQRLVDELWAP